MAKLTISLADDAENESRSTDIYVFRVLALNAKTKNLVGQGFAICLHPFAFHLIFPMLYSVLRFLYFSIRNFNHLSISDNVNDVEFEAHKSGVSANTLDITSFPTIHYPASLGVDFLKLSECGISAVGSASVS